MRTRRTIRVCLLFLGIISALGSVPLVLNQIDTMKQAASGGPGGLPLNSDVIGPDALNGVDLERYGLDGMVTAQAPEPARLHPRSSVIRQPTRVLGPDD